MSDELTPGPLEGAHWERIRAHLAALEFDQAAEALSRLLPQVSDPRERVVIYQLLASSCWTWASEQRIRGHEASAAGYREAVRQTYQAALSEFPFHPGLRVAMGMFTLLDEEDPRAALPYLEPVGGQEMAADDEQRRRAVRGVALALLGSLEEAGRELLSAYGDPFPGHLPRPDVSPLGILVRRGVKLPAATVDSLLQQIARYPDVTPDLVNQLRKTLSA